jgi:hypothetical protein
MGLDELAPFRPPAKNHRIQPRQRRPRRSQKTDPQRPALPLPTKPPAKRGRPAAARSAPTWAPWACRWPRWWPTSAPTNAAGTSAGKSSPTRPTRGQRLKDALLRAVDEDTDAFNAIMAAFALPKGTRRRKKPPAKPPFNRPPWRHRSAAAGAAPGPRQFPAHPPNGRHRQPQLHHRRRRGRRAASAALVKGGRARRRAGRNGWKAESAGKNGALNSIDDWLIFCCTGPAR